MATADDEYGERTEQATEHRRQEQRRQGNVAHSAELGISGHLLTSAGLLYLLGGKLVEATARLTASQLEAADRHQATTGDVLKQAEQLAGWSVEHVLPWLLGMLASATVIGLIQTGFLFSTEKLSIRWDLLNPVTGLQRLFSVRSVATLVVSLIKLGLLFTIAALFVWHELPMLLALSSAPAATAFLVIGDSVVRLALILAGSLIVIGLGDYGFQWWKHERDLMMTKDELKREIKEMEGDPIIRHQRKVAHRKLTESRDLNKVIKATFLLNNPTHYSIAFRYEPPEFPAPTVIAKGVDEIALRMREIATEHDIPMIIRPELARQVYRTLEVGESIPAELYDVFIEIMRHVYAITGRTIDLSQVRE